MTLMSLITSLRDVIMSLTLGTFFREVWDVRYVIRDVRDVRDVLRDVKVRYKVR